MDIYDGYYNGDRIMKTNPNTGKPIKKKPTNIRNIVYELIESQVESAIPMPKVHAIHEEDEPLAKRIEDVLIQEVLRLRLEEMNDLQERTVPVQGGTYWHVEWNSHAGYHCTMGDVEVSDRHPKQVIPQPGVFDIDDMEYIFVLLSQPKSFLEEKYGVEIPTDTETDPEIKSTDNDADALEDLVTQNIVYYKNDGGIGMYSWVNDTELEDLDDYQSRTLERCTKCGRVKDGGVCICGNKKFKKTTEDYEELDMDIPTMNGYIPSAEVIGEEPVMNPDGSPQIDMMSGQLVTMPIMQKTKLPYYKPNKYPIVLRRNVRKFGSLLGTSDVDIISDQQDAVSKLGSKIMEKLINGGSFVTLPMGVNIETSDREFKIVRMRNPADKNLIGVVTVQPDTSRDMQTVAMEYDWAKSTLGINDSFQGKYDASAVSGTAKQFQASQAAGRLESKRVMKRNAYKALYEMMFKFLLAYADEPVPVTTKNPDGSVSYSHFSRYDFLKKDAAGEWYWDDEFIFDVDNSLTKYSSRELVWNQIAQNYQAGAFGQIGSPEANVALWTLYAENDYPGADEILEVMKQRMEEQQIAMQQMQAGMLGGENGVPVGQ